MYNKLKELVDKLEAMTDKERDTYLNKCYLDNKEAIDAVVAHDPKDYEMPDGAYIIGSELFED